MHHQSSKWNYIIPPLIFKARNYLTSYVMWWGRISSRRRYQYWHHWSNDKKFFELRVATSAIFSSWASNYFNSHAMWWGIASFEGVFNSSLRLMSNCVTVVDRIYKFCLGGCYLRRRCAWQQKVWVKKGWNALQPYKYSGSALRSARFWGSSCNFFCARRT